jgi:pimeloyl-ACP methyl ester carboxylesterase
MTSEVVAGGSKHRPAIVLVHGAFAESSSWDGVAARLLAAGYRVVALANPLRGVKSDAAGVAAALAAMQGPVVLVGHSYGGSVISGAAIGKTKVAALVFVAAFAPDEGESAASLAGRFPGSTLEAALAPPVPLGDGTEDLYIRQERFAEQFAADVPPERARLMAITQRPIAAAALAEPASGSAWRRLPSWFVHGSEDRNIPPASLAFMAHRAGARRTVVVAGASHVVMVSHPQVVAGLIEDAANSIGPR